MVLAEAFHHSSAPFPPKFKEEWVGRHKQHAALRGPKTARTTVPRTSRRARWWPGVRKSPAGAGQHLCLRSLAGRSVCSGTTWKISVPSARSCRFSIFLCRRWWTTWRTPCGSWISRWRAGYRSAQDLLLTVSFAFSCSSTAVSRTVCRNADRAVSYAHRFADRGADRWHSSSSGSCSRFSPTTEFNSYAFLSGTRFRADCGADR